MEEKNEHDKIPSFSTTSEDAKTQLKVSFKWFITSLIALINDFISIRAGADIQGTVESIKRGSEFKGHNLWILIFSIFIASIGLNINSGAVVIGAMLISPLMGPILGIGLGLGTNDINTLAKSTRNLLVAVTVALLTSYLYFKMTPFVEAQEQILARTKPHLLDVLVAVFGGLAGILANSRSERTNVIPGVAIATALMPPLCTAGYGLATERYDFFFNAFYLFILNGAAITITTLILVRIMRFPIVHFRNPRNELMVKVFIPILSIVLIIPSCIKFYELIQENNFKGRVEAYLEKEVNLKDENRLIKSNYIYDRDTSKIDLFVEGILSDGQVDSLKSRLTYYKLDKCLLTIHQRGKNMERFRNDLNNVIENNTRITDYLEKSKKDLEARDAEIALLQVELDHQKRDTFPVMHIIKELQINYPAVKSMMCASSYPFGVDSTEVPVFVIKWKKKKPNRNFWKNKSAQEEIPREKIYKYLQSRTDADTLCLVVEEEEMK